MLLSERPQVSRDHGKTWRPVTGLDAGLRPVADRRNPARFYALDMEHAKMYTSSDSGQSFTAAPATGLPPPQEAAPAMNVGQYESRPTLYAAPGLEGDLWYTSKAGMFHSTDGGVSFARLEKSVRIIRMGFGMAAPGKKYPAMYAGGTLDSLTGLFRSDDMGKSWVRINDDQHQWGNRYEAVTGDPRIYGRVYVGTNGRGIVYGDINTKK